MFQGSNNLEKIKFYLSKVKIVKVNRSYQLKVYGSKTKFEDLRWSAYQYTKMANAFINHLYFKDEVKFFSTKGLGVIGNQAQQKALGIVRSKKSNEENNGHKKSVPYYSVLTCFANIKKQSTSSHFNYRINFGSVFAEERSKPRYIFAKGITPLKKALKEGWELSDQCELFFEPIDNHWYVRVFVSKELCQAMPKSRSIGIDVGINHIISTSENYLGKSLSKRIKRINKSRKEKARQLSLAKNRKEEKLVEILSKNLTKNKKIKKTIIKQPLDKEAKRVIARGLQTSSNLVVEDPKILANLRGAKGLRRWARTYFAYRLQSLGKEKGVFVVTTNPAFSSVTCPKCGDKEKRNRDGLIFHCQNCGHRDHADVNASINLARKGQEQVNHHIIPKFNKIRSVRALSNTTSV